ncbi:hypothetical protein [Undibacterium macrobrachii]|uniref:Uncharacterized protein n=1 Tax=Undibacterium macrobrachii TaxID=1119058 RepID=A0ABQ2XMP1_9BURK|nr:hypothetical protein [Undibacterium macrobrachii]GGX23289.1 hypothetical protein GCM10011282_31730 [Undibacterium macrobrachii]
MYPSSKQVALIIAVLFKRSEKTRARVSEKTIKSLARRTTLRSAFTSDLRCWLEDFGILLVQLDRGGFALVTIAALEGAPTILAKNYVKEERKALASGTLNEDTLFEELGITSEEDED